MSEPRHPPIAREHYHRLTVLATQGIADLHPTLELADAVALVALLKAWEWLEPTARRQVQVTVAGPDVRMLWTAPLPNGRMVTLPFELDPDRAEQLSDALGEAAEFARMTRNHEGGSKT